MPAITQNLISFSTIEQHCRNIQLQIPFRNCEVPAHDTCMNQKFAKYDYLKKRGYIFEVVEATNKHQVRVHVTSKNKLSRNFQGDIFFNNFSFVSFLNFEYLCS